MTSSGLEPSQTSTDGTTAEPAHTSPSSSTVGIVNPLVSAGLIPPDLADILATPAADAATQRKVRRVTKARVLTAQDMMQEKERQEKEAAELKKRRKEEREVRFPSPVL